MYQSVRSGRRIVTAGAIINLQHDVTRLLTVRRLLTACANGVVAILRHYVYYLIVNVTCVMTVNVLYVIATDGDAI